MSDLKIFSSDISVSGKRVIVRLDLNVPINNSKIDDDTRIKAIEPFINKLIENKAKVICIDGDGSIQINIQELHTISSNNLPIKIIVMNNFVLVSCS